MRSSVCDRRRLSHWAGVRLGMCKGAQAERAAKGRGGRAFCCGGARRVCRPQLDEDSVAES